MQGPREAKRARDWHRKRNARLRRRRGMSKNGATGWLDDIGMERLFHNSKRLYSRRWSEPDGQ